MSTPAPQQKISFPTITDESVVGFAKAWDYNGIKMILDRTSIQFAKDLANQTLKSYVIDLMNKALMLKNAKEAAAKQANPAASVQADPAPAPQKSSIILTD